MTFGRKGRNRADSSRAPPVIASDDSLTATQLSDLVKSGFGLSDELNFEYNFEYKEADPDFLIEISEYFYESENDDFIQCELDFSNLFNRVFHQSTDFSWKDLDKQQQKDFILILMDMLEMRALKTRLEAINSLLYIVMGNFENRDISSRDSLLSHMKRNVLLISECGSIPCIVQCLVAHTDRLPASSIATSLESNLEDEFLPLFIKQLCNFIYVYVEVHRVLLIGACADDWVDAETEEVFLRELMLPIKVNRCSVNMVWSGKSSPACSVSASSSNSPESIRTGRTSRMGSAGCGINTESDGFGKRRNGLQGAQLETYDNVAVFLFVMICRYGMCWSSKFPVKKIVLLFWKVLLVVTKGESGSKALKTRNLKLYSKKGEEGHGSDGERGRAKGRITAGSKKLRIRKSVLNDLIAGMKARSYSYFKESKDHSSGRVSFDLPPPLKERIEVLKKYSYETLGDLQLNAERARVLRDVLGVRVDVEERGECVSFSEEGEQVLPRALKCNGIDPGADTSSLRCIPWIERLYRSLMRPFSLIVSPSSSVDTGSSSNSTILSRGLVTLLQIMLASGPSASSGSSLRRERSGETSKGGGAALDSASKNGNGSNGKKAGAKKLDKGSRTAALLEELVKFGNADTSDQFRFLSIKDDNHLSNEGTRHLEILFKSLCSIFFLLFKNLKANHIFQFEYCADLFVETNGLLLLLKTLNENIVDYVTRKPDFNPKEGDNQITFAFLRHTSLWKKPPARRHTMAPSPSGSSVNLTGKLGSAMSLVAEDVGTLEQKKAVLTKCSWRNMQAIANVARILQKLTKDRRASIDLLLEFKASVILKKASFINQKLIKKYILKVIKCLVPFLGKKWRDSNMKLMTEIYRHVRMNINDNWAFGNSVFSENAELMKMSSLNCGYEPTQGVGMYPSDDFCQSVGMTDNDSEGLSDFSSRSSSSDNFKMDGSGEDRFVGKDENEIFIKRLEKKARLRQSRQLAVLKYSVQEFNYFHYLSCESFGSLYHSYPGVPDYDNITDSDRPYPSCHLSSHRGNRPASSSNPSLDSNVYSRRPGSNTVAACMDASKRGDLFSNTDLLPPDCARLYSYYYYHHILLYDGCDGKSIGSRQGENSVNAVDLWLLNPNVATASSSSSHKGEEDAHANSDGATSMFMGLMSFGSCYPLSSEVYRGIDRALGETLCAID